MKKIILLTVILLLSYNIIYGQTTTSEEPVSLKTQIPALNINAQTYKVLPTLDMNKIEQEEKEREENGLCPRFGFKHEVSYNLTNSGEWIELSNGDRIWRLRIYCPDATLINILYDYFLLPEGAKFFMYSTDYQYQLGAYTSKNNQEEQGNMRQYATGLVHSDDITLEYYVPIEIEDTGIISISHVVHGYPLSSLPNRGGFGQSWSGHTNINCPAGVNWQDEKDAVVRILTGDSFCSGALVNTTANGNNNHYILTAWHCLDNNVGYWKFYWHYEAPGCPNPPNEPLLIETEGATVVANNYYGDFALIKLYDDPAEKWDVMPYYLGWDRSSNVPIGGSVIHHPMGDVKKIINPIGTVEEQSKAYYWCNHYAMISLKTHWKFNSGEEKIVEGGSSGSPFLNSNHKLMGHHTSVKSMGNQHGVWYEIEFSKLSWAWDADYCNPNSTKRLKDWLDPINTGAITVDGRGGCQKTIKLWKSLPKPMYHALQNIISKQIIESGANASYKAGMEIVLQDGFHAKAGSTFKASIEACNSSTSMAPPAPSDEPNDDDLNNIIFDINELQLYAFQIYPNPAKNELNISGTIAPTYVCIYNFTGQLLYETEHCAANMIISVSSLPSGIYFVKIVSENGITTKKVVVEN